MSKTHHSSSMRMSGRRKIPTGVIMIFGIMAVTLYMAFAFPYTLLHLKQTDTSEIKSVIIVALAGEKSPSLDSYFSGEQAPEELDKIGFEQLTNTGKERMYLLGKFLKLRYYNLLLNGNPRKIYARSADSDLYLESTQALLAGLNPAKGGWLWSSSNELNQWQPKAIHATEPSYDDLLSPEMNCFKLEQDKLRWKNSSKYQQLVNEFRHDLQTLRLNTGLNLADDLEELSDLEDALKTRKAFKDQVPVWYSSTFANRLAHIADVTSESRFNSPYVQRLYVGRLLHEITENINTRIRLHQLALVASKDDSNNLGSGFGGEKVQPPHKFKSAKLKYDPTIFIYMTDKHRLSALLNSLQIYSSQPHFGSQLLIELHYDPINQLHFLRMFTISSTIPNSFPEPLRVNPIACADTVECAPQQFEQNIRHLLLDKTSWQEACLNSVPTTTAKPLTPLIYDEFYTIKPPADAKHQITTTTPLYTTTLTPPPTPTQLSISTSTSTLPTTTTTATATAATTTTTTTTVAPTTIPTTTLESATSTLKPAELEKLEEVITVGPTNYKPAPLAPDSDQSQRLVNDDPTMSIPELINNESSTTVSTTISVEQPDTVKGLINKTQMAEINNTKGPSQLSAKSLLSIESERKALEEEIKPNPLPSDVSPTVPENELNHFHEDNTDTVEDSNEIYHLTSGLADDTKQLQNQL